MITSLRLDFLGLRWGLCPWSQPVLLACCGFFCAYGRFDQEQLISQLSVSLAKIQSNGI